MFVDDRPGAAWVHLGQVMIVFDFTVARGAVTRIQFRAEPSVLAGVRRRRASAPVDGSPGR